MTFRHLLGLWVIACALAWVVGCSSPATAPTPASNVAAKPTPLATPTPLPTSENCVKCHTDQETLKKIAVDKVEKSEATEGEG